MISNTEMPKDMVLKLTNTFNNTVHIVTNQHTKTNYISTHYEQSENETTKIPFPIASKRIKYL